MFSNSRFESRTTQQKCLLCLLNNYELFALLICTRSVRKKFKACSTCAEGIQRDKFWYFDIFRVAEGFSRHCERFNLFINRLVTF